MTSFKLQQSHRRQCQEQPGLTALVMSMLQVLIVSSMDPAYQLSPSDR